MLEELYNNPIVPATPKVYWWRSRAFRIGLAIFVALAVIAVVLFNQQIGNLLRSFGSKAATEITLDGANPNSESYFFGAGYTATPADSLKVENNRLMLNPNPSILSL